MQRVQAFGPNTFGDHPSVHSRHQHRIPQRSLQPPRAPVGNPGKWPEGLGCPQWLCPEGEPATSLPVSPALLSPSWAPPALTLSSLCPPGFLSIVFGLRNPFNLSVKNGSKSVLSRRTQSGPSIPVSHGLCVGCDLCPPCQGMATKGPTAAWGDQARSQPAWTLVLGSEKMPDRN